MDDSEIAALLNMPSTGLSFSNSAPATGDGTFQLDMDAAFGEEAIITPKDQIVTGIKSFEQLALIVSIDYKGKYGTPMLDIGPTDAADDQNEALLNFHLHNE